MTAQMGPVNGPEMPPAAIDVPDWPEDLQSAREQVTGQRVVVQERLLHKQGWTAATYRRLDRLGAHAAQMEAIVAQQHPRRLPPQQLATRELVSWAEGLARNGLLLEEIAQWLRLLVEQTGEPGATLVRDHLDRIGSRLLSGPGLPDEAYALRRWAPWVWAAGVSYTEGFARLRREPLDPEGLRTLAALRGIRLPADPWTIDP